MPTLVQKYGGSSVKNADRIRAVAERVVTQAKRGAEVVVVVSAMGHTTDDLVRMAFDVSPRPEPRELDILLTAGERISMALLAMAINDLGAQAISLTGSQAGIVTDTAHGKAKIVEIRGERVRRGLDDGKIVIVAGFQGVSTSLDITTLGRGGSDTTAVALAAALSADVCEIYTDVEGVYSADPRICPRARKLRHVSYEEMLELAASGSKIVHGRAVEFGRRFRVPIHVRSSYTDAEGTWLVATQEVDMEQPLISGVAHDTSESKLTLVGVPDKPGIAGRLFRALADAEVVVDMIVQNVGHGGSTDISFTVPESESSTAGNVLRDVSREIGAGDVVIDREIARVSVVGAGMKNHPGVAATMFEALSDVGVNIEMISTSEIRISCVVRRDRVREAVRAVHGAFELDTDTDVGDIPSRGA